MSESLRSDRTKQEYEWLTRSVAAMESERDVVRVSGPDAVSFLQGQMSQDVAGMTSGESAWSFILTPTGKVVALVRVTHLGEHGVLLDVDSGYGEAVVARLERFRLRVACEMELKRWQCIALRGPHAVARSSEGIAHLRPVVASSVPWPTGGMDLLAPELGLPEGLPLVSRDAYEAVRIESGWPSMAGELSSEPIPAETGLVELAASFSKGCYVGQELVTRMHSRGAEPPRHLRAAVCHRGGAEPEPGAQVVVDDALAGEVTSVAFSPLRDAHVCLAYVRRSVPVPQTAEVRWAGGSVGVDLLELPLHPAQDSVLAD